MIVLVFLRAPLEIALPFRPISDGADSGDFTMLINTHRDLTRTLPWAQLLLLY